MKVTAEVIEGFVKSLLQKNFDEPKEIPKCHIEWWKACCSENKFVAIGAPRGHAKSTAITHSYTLAVTLFRERRFVILVSDTETQAILFLGDIKKEILDNEDLQKLFEIKAVVKDTESDIIVEFTDGAQFRIMAKGSGQKVRGLKWGNKRPDLIVCDDMENDELVMNKERREKLKEWFVASLLPIRSDLGVIRMVGTILHANSLLAGFLPVEHHPDVLLDGLKLYSTRPRSWFGICYRAHDRDFRRVLWPAKMPAAELMRIRQMYEEQGNLDKYSQEYLNLPIDESNTHFRRSDFLDLSPSDREKNLTYYLTMDLAVTEKTYKDYTVFMMSGMDPDGYVQVRHVVRDRMDSLQIVDTIFNLVKTYDPSLVVTEKGMIWNTIYPLIVKKQQEDNLFFQVELFASTTDKVHRSQAIRARARAGRVKVDKGAPWWPDLEDELMRFPRLGKDDQVDALSLVGQTINKFWEAPTHEEVQQDLYDDELENSGLMSVGRSETTGY